MKYIIEFSKNIGKWHAKFFMWLSDKAESHPLWAWALTFWALYEIFEHIALPTVAILWGTGQLTIK
jgi:hypothetical protein